MFSCSAESLAGPKAGNAGGGLARSPPAPGTGRPSETKNPWAAVCCGRPHSPGFHPIRWPAAAYIREPGGRGAPAPAHTAAGEVVRARGPAGCQAWCPAEGRRPPRRDCASAPPAPAAPAAPAAPGCAEAAAAAAMAMVPPAPHPPRRPASWAAKWRRRGGAAATLQVRSCGPWRRPPRGQGGSGTGSRWVSKGRAGPSLAPAHLLSRRSPRSSHLPGCSPPRGAREPLPHRPWPGLASSPHQPSPAWLPSFPGLA